MVVKTICAKTTAASWCTRDGRVVKLEGDPGHPLNRGHEHHPFICFEGATAHQRRVLNELSIRPTKVLRRSQTRASAGRRRQIAPLPVDPVHGAVGPGGHRAVGPAAPGTCTTTRWRRPWSGC